MVGCLGRLDPTCPSRIGARVDVASVVLRCWRKDRRAVKVASQNQLTRARVVDQMISRLTITTSTNIDIVRDLVAPSLACAKLAAH